MRLWALHWNEDGDFVKGPDGKIMLFTTRAEARVERMKMHPKQRAMVSVVRVEIVTLW